MNTNMVLYNNNKNNNEFNNKYIIIIVSNIYQIGYIFIALVKAALINVLVV